MKMKKVTLLTCIENAIMIVSGPLFGTIFIVYYSGLPWFANNLKDIYLYQLILSLVLIAGEFDEISLPQRKAFVTRNREYLEAKKKEFELYLQVCISMACGSSGIYFKKNHFSGFDLITSLSSKADSLLTLI